MKKPFLIPVLLLLLLAGCQGQERAERLRAKEAELQRREEQLLIREQALAVREKALVPRPEEVDSTRQAVATDTSAANPSGIWAVRMNCIETDCPGSAIGDTKSEQWQISSAQGQVLVKASVNDKVVRVYTGTRTGPTLSLTAQHTEDDDRTRPDAVITVQLRATSPQRLEGRREIVRPGNCRIVYALELTKPQALPLTPAL